MNKNDKSTHHPTQSNKQLIELYQTQPNNKPKMEKQLVLKHQKVNVKDMQNPDKMLNPLDFKFLHQSLEHEKRELQIYLNHFVKDFKKGDYSKKEVYALRIYTLKLAIMCFKYSEQLKDSEFPVSISIKDELSGTLLKFLRDHNEDNDS